MASRGRNVTASPAANANRWADAQQKGNMERGYTIIAVNEKIVEVCNGGGCLGSYQYSLDEQNTRRPTPDAADGAMCSCVWGIPANEGPEICLYCGKPRR